jgi:hypothetical protein
MALELDFLGRIPILLMVALLASTSRNSTALALVGAPIGSVALISGSGSFRSHHNGLFRLFVFDA